MKKKRRLTEEDAKRVRELAHERGLTLLAFARLALVGKELESGVDGRR